MTCAKQDMGLQHSSLPFLPRALTQGYNTVLVQRFRNTEQVTGSATSKRNGWMDGWMHLKIAPRRIRQNCFITHNS